MFKVLFLHGLESTPGGRKPRFLAERGFEVINPALPKEACGEINESVCIAQAAFDQHGPSVVVGSSRGGAVAMSIAVGPTPLVLLCPAWKKFGDSRTVKPGTVILHSPDDEIIPIADSHELLRSSGLDATSLVLVGTDHRLSDEDSLSRMHQMVTQVLGLPSR